MEPYISPCHILSIDALQLYKTWDHHNYVKHGPQSDFCLLHNLFCYLTISQCVSSLSRGHANLLCIMSWKGHLSLSLSLSLILSHRITLMGLIIWLQRVMNQKTISCQQLKLTPDFSYLISGVISINHNIKHILSSLPVPYSSISTIIS